MPTRDSRLERARATDETGVMPPYPTVVSVTKLQSRQSGSARASSYSSGRSPYGGGGRSFGGGGRRR